MKIRKLELRNYKIFRDVAFDFTDNQNNTQPVIVLAGVNGSGKTTILELIKDLLSGNTLEEINPDFELLAELDLNHLKWADVFLSELMYRKRELQSTLQHKNGILNLHFKQKKRPLRSFSDFQVLMEVYNLVRKAEKDKSCFVYRYSQDKVKGRKSKNVSESFHEISFNTHKEKMKDLILKPINQLMFKNRDIPPKQVIENEIYAINSIFEGLHLNTKLVDIEAEELIFSNVNQQRVLFENLSSGEKLIYFMGFYLNKLTINQSVILVDEPEDSLHPSWQKQIIKFYTRIGNSNQVIVATHSPFVIGAVNANFVYLLKFENEKVIVSQPKYSKGHSIPYVLSEIMETDYRDTYISTLTEEYLMLIRENKQDSERGLELWKSLSDLDPNSEERMRIDFSIRRMKATGK